MGLPSRSEAAALISGLQTLLNNLGSDGVLNASYWLALYSNVANMDGGVTAFSSGATQTATTGSNWTALTAGACNQIVLRNRTGTSIDFRITGDTTVFTLLGGEDISLPALANSNEWEIRRTDTGNTQVTVRFFRYTR